MNHIHLPSSYNFNFTQANDVKDALSNMLLGSVEQTQLILSKRAEYYQLALRAPNQLKNLFCW